MNTILSDLYCRLCADLKPVKQLTNMIINTEKCREVTNKLSRLDLHVNFNTKLPKTVCFECINSLERAYDFVKSVELAQEAFEDYDSSVLNPSEVKDEDSDNDSTATASNRDDVSVKSEVDDNDNDALDEYVPKNKANSSKSKSETRSVTSKITTYEPDMPEDTDTGNDLLVEYVPKNKARVRETTIPEQRTVKSKTTSTTANRRQRNKPKVSANVDLDTWNDYDWLCGICDKYFRSPSELKVHSMQYHYICNPYRCYDCRARGLHMDNFVTHIARHRPVLTLMCYLCPLKFETQKDLKAHKATHFETEHICSGCNTWFINQEELDDHKRRFYKSADMHLPLVVTENHSLTCVICDKTSKSKLTLSRHLLLHTDRKRTHVCDTCGNSFYNRQELMQHQIVHTDKRPYKCEVCNFAFKIKHELKKHALIHFGPKRHCCNVCGKWFRLSKELVVHKAVHNEIRPYKCSLCESSFRFKHLLRQHGYVHTGLKPYACADCPQTFANWSNYNKHTKFVHGVINSRRKRTSEGLYALDPETKEVIYPDKQKVLEWKMKILGNGKKGRPKKATTAVGNKTKTKIKSTR
ncbi:hypothetical protein PYW07_011604 [Mythimna separata]|uniref:Uncharacterized protein n=1 Tax=Mythimna separata TaxID=271217 RepID=A0AAD7Y6F0_MYTSE|nr:hypothetical protein PYW07_011604 [Mythimna separata]